MSTVPAILMSEEDFLALPESTQRQELLDGEVVVSPSPSMTHQRIVLRLASWLLRWADEHSPAFVGLSPLDVRLGRQRIVQPDLFVLLHGASGQTPIDAVPDLVIEVLSHNRSYDRLAKRFVYEQAGVREYWMVDPERRCIEVVLNGAHREERAHAISGVLADFSVDVHALFSELTA